MNHEDLPRRWQEKVKEWLIAQGEHPREKLRSYDFNPAIVARIEFEDGSLAVFHYPLVIRAPELKEVGVFTEHCGYHIFNSDGIKIMIEPRQDE